MPNNKVYLLIGVPGSGKSWVGSRVKDQVLYLEQDSYIGSAPGAYIRDIIELTPISKKPVLIEAPFSVSKIRGPLLEAGLDVTCLYICEDIFTLENRYREREGKDIPKGHITRNSTYIHRAISEGDYVGTSKHVLEELLRLLSDK